MAKDFKQFRAGSCYSYILSSNQEAIVIDPHISLLGVYAKYLDKNKLNLKYIIDTHTHADHFSLAAILKDKFGVPILMHEKAVSEIADKRLNDGDEIKFGDKKLKVIYGPGHTDDTMALCGDGRVFTADVLLIGSVGRTDFQNGSHADMFDTLQKLKSLPPDILVFPAHDYNDRKFSTIAKEKATNPFMQQTDKDSFVKNASFKILPKPFNIDNIIRVNQKGQAKALEMISPKVAQEFVAKDQNVKLLDVRSALEYSDAHIKNSINIPIDMLTSKIKDLSGSGQAYIVLCRTGNRSPMAADMLVQSGISSVKVMEGGIERWKKERLPLIKGQGGVSLERQVRLIAGIMMLLGILLAWLIHWGFIFISVWVACGLIFAGITDSCLMGMLLMKFPYNKKMYKAKLGGTCSISQ